MYLGDKELNVVSYALQLAVLEYQTAIMRKDFDAADKVKRRGGCVCVCVLEFLQIYI